MFPCQPHRTVLKEFRIYYLLRAKKCQTPTKNQFLKHIQYKIIFPRFNRTNKQVLFTKTPNINEDCDIIKRVAKKMTLIRKKQSIFRSILVFLLLIGLHLSMSEFSSRSPIQMKLKTFYIFVHQKQQKGAIMFSNLLHPLNTLHLNWSIQLPNFFKQSHF